MFEKKPIKLDLLHKIKAEWIDYNGHMNVAYYLLAFDEAIDEINQKLGLGPNYKKQTNKSTFALECHIIWLDELKLNETISFDIQLIDHDRKRIHFFVKMMNEKKNILAATYEVLLMHMDLNTKKSCDFPENVEAKIKLIMKYQKNLSAPKGLGSIVGIRRK